MIRALREQDAEAYAVLRREALLDAPLAFAASPEDDVASSPESLREQLRRAPEAMIFGAFRAGLVGAIGLYRDRHLKASHKVHLWGTYVTPPHRRQGLGAGLLEAALSHAATLQGITWVHLSVSSEAPAARRLYECFGFRVWGEEPEALRHQERTAVEHHMALRLPPDACWRRGMTALRKEAYGPEGDPSRHRPLAELEAGFRALVAAPVDAGHLDLIVRRRVDGVRETPERVRLTLEEGVPGDGWSRRPPRDPEAQLAVMRRDVAELLANGQPLHVFGDNLFVHLDLSQANLPAGTLLRVGEALVEVTRKPHNGCVKFKGRFGADALRFVQAPATRDRNLRGIYWRVVEPGEARLGDSIEIVSRDPVESAGE